MGLLDDISKLTTPASELPDLEDDSCESSFLKKAGENRSKQAKSFNFEEGKYAGSSISRKEIFGDISGISGLQGKNTDTDDDVECEDEEEEEEDLNDDEEKEINSENSSDVEDSDGDSNGEDSAGESDSMEDEENNDSDEERDETMDKSLGITTLSLQDDSDKADKATTVRHQREVWDDLMYSNIRIHALLNAINQMPRGEARKSFLKDCDESTRKSMEKALENMGKLRSLIKCAADSFENDGKSKGNDEDDEEVPSDEEIPSDFDEEDDDEDDAGSDSEDVKINSRNSGNANNSGASVKSLKNNLGKLDISLEKFRSNTITKWYNRTKILNSVNSADFSVFEKGSILGQINKILADEDKLLKKVRTNRSGKPRIGGPPAVNNIDYEIFDDSEFYQFLLKQMLESRSQTSSLDGADMTRSYMELQSVFNNKKKRDVSQLSSKDRRLKYEPIAKLINFYPSKPSVVTWSHESRNELFKSLFS